MTPPRMGQKEIQRKTHINALELLAIVAAVWTVGKEFLQNCEVVFFCDNTSAMSAAVHGYARSPNLAALSNTLHLTLAALKCTPFLEWVPSFANCADIPSRPQRVTEEAFYARVKVTRWPGKNKRIVFSVIFRCFAHQKKISSV